jgi:hypothetical protein
MEEVESDMARKKLMVGGTREYLDGQTKENKWTRASVSFF